jgi:hypothetical protein
VNFLSVDCDTDLTVSIANRDVADNELIKVSGPRPPADQCPNSDPNSLDCIVVQKEDYPEGEIVPMQDFEWTIRRRPGTSTAAPLDTEALPTDRAVLRDNVRALTIRTEPGIDNPVRGYLLSDQVAAILEEPREVGSSPWVRIRNLDTDVTGWVNGSYLSSPSPSAAELDAAAPAAAAPAEELQVGSRAQLRPGVKALNIRTGPGTDNPVVDHMQPEDVVLLQDGPQMIAGEPWYAILNESRQVEGWVNGRYLVPERRSFNVDGTLTKTGPTSEDMLIRPP